MYTRIVLPLLMLSCAPAVLEILPDDDALDGSSDLETTAQDAAQRALDGCFEGFLGTQPAPDYAQFGPTIGSHCAGTDHQDIEDVERVVFLGDSITVGTPPTPVADMYRVRLARDLASRYGLEAPRWSWENVNLINGRTLVQRSGAFSSCAAWGAKTRDLTEQLEDCFPAGRRGGRTLVVLTVGGNDLAALAQRRSDGASTASLWSDTQELIGELERGVRWLKDPDRFEDEVSVVMSNLLEFTDATGDTSSCPTASLAGFGQTVNDPEVAQMVVFALERYMALAVETGSDMLFLQEAFCGHGFARDDPAGRCYRGPDAELWFDLTCIHPNSTGHAQIAKMVVSVVEE